MADENNLTEEEITEQALIDAEGIPEIETAVEIASQSQAPVDRTLSIQDMAADAQATGQAISDLAADVVDLNTAVTEIQGWTGEDIPLTGDEGAETIAGAVEALQEQTGADIPVNGTSGAATIAAAVAGLQERTGEDIPITDEEDADSIADAVGALETGLAGLTGAGIPLTADTGADTVAAAVAELQARTGTDIMLDGTVVGGTIAGQINAIKNNLSGYITSGAYMGLSAAQEGNAARNIGIRRETFTIPAGGTFYAIEDSEISANTVIIPIGLNTESLPGNIGWSTYDGGVSFSGCDQLTANLIFTALLMEVKQ